MDGGACSTRSYSTRIPAVHPLRLLPMVATAITLTTAARAPAQILVCAGLRLVPLVRRSFSAIGVQSLPFAPCALLIGYHSQCGTPISTHHLGLVPLRPRFTVLDSQVQPLGATIVRSTRRSPPQRGDAWRWTPFPLERLCAVRPPDLLGAWRRRAPNACRRWAPIHSLARAAASALDRTAARSAVGSN